jgi:very-short-patch-repair endonuclease
VRGRFYELDCVWERERAIVELDGHAVHGTHRAFEADRERDRILLAEGWRPMRVTWRQLRDEPEAVIGDLQRLLGHTSYP